MKTKIAANVIHYNDETSSQVLRLKTPTLFYMTEHNASPNFDVLQQTLDQWPKLFKDRDEMSFVVSSITGGVNQFIGEFFGVVGMQLPKIMIVEPQKDGQPNKYQFQGDANSISVELLSLFIHDYFDGRLLKVFRSENEFNLEDDSPFVPLVTKNFNKVTQDTSKDVVIFFWEKDCEYCDRLEPIAKKLAKRSKYIKDFIVCRFNVDLNEIEELTHQDVPSVRLYLKGNKNFIKMDTEYMDSDYKGITGWIAKHSTAYKPELEIDENQIEPQGIEEQVDL